MFRLACGAEESPLPKRRGNLHRHRFGKRLLCGKSRAQRSVGWSVGRSVGRLSAVAQPFVVSPGHTDERAGEASRMRGLGSESIWWALCKQAIALALCFDFSRKSQFPHSPQPLYLLSASLAAHAFRRSCVRMFACECLCVARRFLVLCSVWHSTRSVSRTRTTVDATRTHVRENALEATQSLVRFESHADLVNASSARVSLSNGSFV